MATLKQVVHQIFVAKKDPKLGESDVVNLIEHQRTKAYNAGYNDGFRHGQHQLRRELRAMLGIKHEE